MRENPLLSRAAFLDAIRLDAIISAGKRFSRHVRMGNEEINL